MNWNLSEATLSDAEAILALQKLAYQREAALHDDFTIPPLVQSLEDLRATFDDHVFLKATVDDRLAGSVRARQDGPTWHIGRLIVHPEFQKKGIGTDLMQQIEARGGAASRYELFTGHKSADNLRFYARLGYREFKRKVISSKLTLVFMEKPRE